MHFLTVTIVMSCLIFVSCNAVSPQTESKAALQAVPISIGENFRITSTITGEIHEVNVWMPPETSESKKTHPVLYLIDGGLDQDFHHISGLAQLSVINNRFNTPIVVGIRTNNRYYQLTPAMTDSRYLSWNGTKGNPEMGGADDFHHYIVEEVMPFIEARYPTSERKAIIGESLAGFYVIREFLRHPNSFTDYISISPSLWLDDQKLAKSADKLLAVQDDKARNLYLTMADEGGTMQAGLDKVLAAIEARNFDNLNMIYTDRRNRETHSTIYHPAALDALTQLFGLPVPDYGSAPWYLREGGKPEDDR